MVIIKEANPRNIFQTRLAVVTIDLEFINLTFDEPFTGVKMKFKKGDSISKPYFSHGEIDYMRREFKINKLPYEIFNEYELKDIYDFVRK